MKGLAVKSQHCQLDGILLGLHMIIMSNPMQNLYNFDTIKSGLMFMCWWLKTKKQNCSLGLYAISKVLDSICIIKPILFIGINRETIL